MDSTGRLSLKSALAVGLLIVASAAQAQDVKSWAKDTTGDIAFEFPEPFRSYNANNASGLIYHQGDVFITLTNIPDTSGKTGQDHNRKYYTETVGKAVKRLKGRLLVVTDTLLGDVPAHFSRIEVLHPNGGITHYELMQILRRDTLRAFSCQYVPEDSYARVLRDRFLNSIHVAQPTASQDTTPVGGFPWYLVAMVLVVVFLGAILWRSRGVSAKTLRALP